MKRTLFFCAALTVSAAAFAQKSNVRKLEGMIDYATHPVNMDYSNLEPEKIQQIRTLITEALDNDESKDQPLLWKYASRLKIYDMNEMLKQYTANGNKLVDPKAFFQNQADVVTYLEKYNALINTPNEKGKIKMKAEERQKERTFWQQHAAKARTNLVSAASQSVNDDPAQTIKYLDLYYASANDSLFVGVSEKVMNPVDIADTYYIYATALRGIKADSSRVNEYLEKSLASKSYGKNAAFELMDADKEAGNMDAWKARCEKAINQYPDEGVFGRLLMQQYVNDSEWAKCDALADRLIERNKAANTVDEWPYYFKAVSLFSQEKYEDAYKAFETTATVKPDFVEAYTNAGTTAWKLAQTHATQKDVSKSWYAKAIENFEKARELAPDDSEKWGYSLYACYNNSGQTEKAKEFKQYDKK